jgi:predicted CXXCH cytochrome family protein
MTFPPWLLILLLPVAILLPQLTNSLGRKRGSIAAGALLLVVGASWSFVARTIHIDRAEVEEIGQGSVSSETCFKCHEGHYASWHRTYHRTMTREATPENVKGDFREVTYEYQGIPTHLTRQGDSFYMETLDQAWAARAAQRGAAAGNLATAQVPLRRYKVERLVGSHWFQECLTKDDQGRYWRLPVSYHIVEQRWIHTNGAFLAPDTPDFWSKSTVWNESCVFCHNTKPSKLPLRPAWDESRTVGYATDVAELGIACEACHGPGAAHVHANQNVVRRYAVQGADTGDPTIVNPKRLSVQRADDICAHCHGGLVPRPEAWDFAKVTDPFNAGDDLSRFNRFFWSEAEQMKLYGQSGRKHGTTVPGAVPTPDETVKDNESSRADGRFWGDGTALTTAVEYQGMARSACYQGGHGKLSCLSCHSMHDSKPNFLLARHMETNEGCYQCHESYRQRLVEHTHHGAGSPGSLCYNCHMSYQVYSLLTTHRSHRIEALRVKDSLGTGKPHACNLCHLDQSLGWTQDWLSRWYGRTPEPLPEEEKKYSSALLHLCRSDARSRVVVAGAFSWPAAHEASGTDWEGPVLARLLERERYPAVRYLLHRGLRSLHGDRLAAYDYLAGDEERGKQLHLLEDRLKHFKAAATHRYLPLTAEGRPDDAILKLLLQKRNDPDVLVHE